MTLRASARQLLFSSGSSREWLGKTRPNDLRSAWLSFPVPAHWPRFNIEGPNRSLLPQRRPAPTQTRPIRIVHPEKPVHLPPFLCRTPNVITDAPPLRPTARRGAVPTNS